MRIALRTALVIALVAAGGATSKAADSPGAWTRGPAMRDAHNEAAGAYAAGRFYVIAGNVQSAEYYDPASGEWTTIAAPPINRGLARAAVVGGMIYVFGGCVHLDCNSMTGANWAYDIKADTWREKAPLPLPRYGMTADVIGGKIYVAGGYLAGYRLDSALLVYDPVADAWTAKSSMPLVRANGGSGVVDGKLYYAGGSDNGYGQTVDPKTDVLVYDPATDRWSMRAPLPSARAYPQATSLNGKIYLFGGHDTPTTISAGTWVYDPAANSWSLGSRLNDARAGAATAAGGGTLFTAGSVYRDGWSTSFEFAAMTPAALEQALHNKRREAAPPQSAPAVAAEPAPAPARPADYALVIGIEKYSHLPQARFAENDADAMKKRLLALGYPERNIILLKGGRATRGAVQGYVEEWLPKNAHSDSRVFVYFSGHGSPDPKNGDAYLVPWDGDAMFLKSTAYPLESLYASLGKLKVKHVIVALDSCFSGAGGRSVLVAGARPLVSRVDQTDAPLGVTVLTAASGDEITGTIDEQGHGAFTYYLLEALNRRNPTVRAAYDELKPLVQDEAHRQNREQTPLMLGIDASF